MKKVMMMLVLLSGFSGSVLLAQQGDGNFDPAKMKERQLQQLKGSDLKLTDAQADSIVSINMEARQQMKGFRDLSEDERRGKMKEMNDYRMKRWSSALNDDALVKKVAEYYEKQRMSRMNGGGKS